MKSLKNFYYITFSKEYKSFISEMQNTSSEEWFMDGERIFSNKEKYFLSLHEIERKLETKLYEELTFSENIMTNNFSFRKFLNAPNANVRLLILHFEVLSLKEKFNSYKNLISTSAKNSNQAYIVDCKIRLLTRDYWW